MQHTPSGTPYRPERSIKDRRFSSSLLAQYHLSLHISGDSFKVSCIDPVANKCLLLDTYKLSHDHGPQRIQALEKIYQDHHLLAAAGWANATLCVDNQQYTLIPERLLQQDQLEHYLALACAVGESSVQHCLHSSFNVAVIFAIEPLLLAWFQETYAPAASLQIIHQATNLIEGAWEYLKCQKSVMTPQVFVFSSATHLHITALQKGRLLYYNRFKYNNSDEFLHYILIVMQSLKLDTNFHTVILAGSTTKNSLAYRKACNYIRNLYCCGRPPHLRFRRFFSPFTKTIASAHFDVLSTHLYQPAKTK